MIIVIIIIIMIIIDIYSALSIFNVQRHFSHD